ncbi:MAG: ATP-dependent DNA helicase RecG [Candidatus Cloacimonetes bacterium]|nr:ATP-dependent DNA helicase RecG [Candidatus Cloacimonadota bacterium]
MQKSKEPIHPLNTPIKYLKGVGEYRARLFASLGIETVEDLMEHFPRTYISRIVNPTLATMQEGEMVSFTATISFIDARPTTKGKKILHVGVNDGDIGLVCVWFQYPQSYLKLFKPGMNIWLCGILSSYNSQLQMNHPSFEILDSDKEEEDFWKTRSMLPLYSLKEGLSQGLLRKTILNCFSKFAQHIPESLPEHILQKHKFPPRRAALQLMHFGQQEALIKQTRIRFAYEEFLYSQILWARHKLLHKQQVEGIQFTNKKQLTSTLKTQLRFELTAAQKRVIREIFGDMCSIKQMSRIIQGDVGSGKTIVSVFAMLLAVENSCQAALMVPTEILADQHYQSISFLLKDLPLTVHLLKGGNYKGKSAIKKAIGSGEANIVIGTHALIQQDIQFHALGLVVVDEQHRFGVEQRAKLSKTKGRPDILYLSATPIPRSLAMTVYGDLEVSRIDELPKGRKPVQTYVRGERKFDTVLNDVRQELQKGRQAYFVCPLVEESEKLALLDAKRLFDYLRNKVYTEYCTELIHGRMTASDKESIMQRFKAGEIKILVSTTVIEVGVDVANASVMVIEHAERFGLAQLHQLRGRVGRGSDQSFCYLLWHQPLSRIARERLNTMLSSTDGFEIAEKDLELRGPGELFGIEQSGMPQFKHANLIQDQDILKIAREDAFDIIAQDSQLSHTENERLRNIYLAKYKEKEELIKY